MQYGLIGEQISYSLSPFIHRFLFKKYQIDATYETLDMDCAMFTDKIEDIRSAYRGVNVTIPYKKSIQHHFPNALWSQEASAIGAVNCVRFEEDQVLFYNTDSYGFIQPLLGRHINEEKKMLILGNGGAMQAVFYALKNQYRHTQIDICARHPKSGQMSFEQLDQFDHTDYSLIVNTTPVSPYVFNKLDQSVILYDLNYRVETCHFLHKHQQYTHINGIEMLVYQAVKSFEIWNKCNVKQSIILELFAEIEVHYGIKQ